MPDFYANFAEAVRKGGAMEIDISSANQKHIQNKTSPYQVILAWGYKIS